MAYSFVRIEKEKSRFIAVLIALLITIYFSTAWLIWFIAKNYFHYRMSSSAGGLLVFPTLTGTAIVFCIALGIASVHFVGSTANMMERALRVLGAKPLDPNYIKHKAFKNVIDEVSVAMGGAAIGGCVINTSSCNAFSASNFSGQPYIGVTEGLLSKLNRSQLEAVVGHEAAHIARGDTLTTSAACSIFGIYEGLLRGIPQTLIRVRGPVAALGVMVYLVLMITHFFNKIVVTFISQQKEFRADAVAVKLTRNPLALARSLYIISKRWHGNDTSIQGLSSLFIADPAPSRISGLSSHPPIEERIAMLLNMAHADKSALEVMTDNLKPQIKAARNSLREKIKKAKSLKTHEGWFVFKDNQWQGPFLFVELAVFGWLRPDNLIRRDGSIEVKEAYQDSKLLSLLKPHTEDMHGRYSCPHCYHGLVEIKYEGAATHKCHICKGLLATREELNKILIREDKKFSQEIVAQAEAALAEKKERFKRIRQIKTSLVINCPHCSRKMKRRLFSHDAPVEIDECGYCGRLWFDYNELEIIQVIYDRLPHKDQVIY